MKRNLELKLLEEGDKVNIYSVQFEGEQYSEFEKFFSKYMDDPKYAKDFDIILSLIDKIKETGALDRFMRYEGKMKDRVMALPIETSSLRLYCIRIDEAILLLGDGGEKTTKTYQEDEFLNECVTILQKVDFVLKKKEKEGIITRAGKNIEGDLSFFINE